MTDNYFILEYRQRGGEDPWTPASVFRNRLLADSIAASYDGLVATEYRVSEFSRADADIPDRWEFVQIIRIMGVYKLALKDSGAIVVFQCGLLSEAETFAEVADSAIRAWCDSHAY